MRKKYVWSLVIGIIILVVPTILYLCFLIPRLTERYNVLMSSAGVLGSFGYIGAARFPDKFKYSSLFKTSANAFTTMVIVMLIQEFIKEIIVLGIIVLVSFIGFCIFKEAYKDGKRREENKQLAEQIARNVNQNAQ